MGTLSCHLHKWESSPTEDNGGKEDNYQSCGHQNLPGLLVKLQMEGESVGDGSPESGEPHDDHHLLGDLVGAKLVAQH